MSHNNHNLDKQLNWIGALPATEEAIRMLKAVNEETLPEVLRLPALLALATWAVEEAPNMGWDIEEAEANLGSLLLIAMRSPRLAVEILLNTADIDPMEEMPSELFADTPENIAGSMVSLVNQSVSL